MTYGHLVIHGNKKLVTVGKYCSIAKDVHVFANWDHRVDWISTYPFKAIWNLGHDGHPGGKGPVAIGNDVWIGWGAIILSGVTIGDGAVIGARSTVTKDVPPYRVVAGNPAIEVRKRFTDEQIAALLRIRWWDWPEKRVRKYVNLLTQPDVDRFITAVSPVPNK